MSATNTDPIAQMAAQTQSGLKKAQSKQNADALGIEDFLKLMTTQLKNQDPMKPLEGTEFVSQLAQFGSVSGIQKMQGSIDSLSTSLRANQALNGATLVGREVLARADGFTYTSGVAVTGEAEVPAGATSLQIRIKDSSGAVVRTMETAPITGTNRFSWDGLRTDGTAAAAGDYEIEAIVTSGGKNVSADVLMAGKVASVTLDATGTNLTLNTTALGAVKMADVRRVM